MTDELIVFDRKISHFFRFRVSPLTMWMSLNALGNYKSMLLTKKWYLGDEFKRKIRRKNYQKLFLLFFIFFHNSYFQDFEHCSLTCRLCDKCINLLQLVTKTFIAWSLFILGCFFYCEHITNLWRLFQGNLHSLPFTAVTKTDGSI